MVGRPVAGRLELALVEGRVGDGELGDRGQVTELGPAPTHLFAHRRHPRLEQVGRGDVVVVDELALAPLAEDVGHPAPDGQLVEQHPPGRRPIAQAADRETRSRAGRAVAFP